MVPTGLNRLLVTGITLVTAIGALDAAIGRQWDLLAVFTIAWVLAVSLLVRLGSSRPEIPVRRDLVVWLRDRAAVSGESVATLADRALGSHRGLYGDVRSHVGEDGP